MAVDLDFEREMHGNLQAAPAGSLFETYADKVLRRVDDVLAGRECPWPATIQQRVLLQLLRKHQGKSRSVALSEIARHTALSERTVKDLVYKLRLDFGVQIGSSRAGEDHGYYLVSSSAESNETAEPMQKQATQMLRVVRALRAGDLTIEQMLTQIRLDLNPGPRGQETTHGQ